MSAELAGRALITAGASGIGLAIARHLVGSGVRCMVCDVDEPAGLSCEDLQRRAVQRISLRRGVTAKDVAALVGFLVSDVARNISGQAIPVDADQTRLG